MKDLNVKIGTDTTDKYVKIGAQLALSKTTTTQRQLIWQMVKR